MGEEEGEYKGEIGHITWPYTPPLIGMPWYGTI